MIQMIKIQKQQIVLSMIIMGLIVNNPYNNVEDLEHEFTDDHHL